jgi:catechol 2,3-dioxygenase-like lactoylglutathione lyase family enzyme
MLDHVSVGVSDVDRSRRFYDAALQPFALVHIVHFSGGPLKAEHQAGCNPQ